VEAEIFDFIGLRKLNIIDFNRWAGQNSYVGTYGNHKGTSEILDSLLLHAFVRY
jgi:hypothetical protein